MVFPPRFLFCNPISFSSLHIILLVHFFLHHHLHLCHERRGGSNGHRQLQHGKDISFSGWKIQHFINTAEWMGRNQASFWKWAAKVIKSPFTVVGRGRNRAASFARGAGNEPVNRNMTHYNCSPKSHLLLLDRRKTCLVAGFEQEACNTCNWHDHNQWTFTKHLIIDSLVIKNQFLPHYKFNTDLDSAQ